jgi:hypothetical protein
VKQLKDKEIVYEDRIRFILTVTLCLVLLIASIWTRNNWGVLIFTIWALAKAYPFIDPNKKIVFIGTKKYKELIKEEFDFKLNDTGIFTYTDSGFNLKLSGTSYNIQWSDIITILSYKMDLMTTDEICMEVFCKNDVSFKLTEETSGWFTFIGTLKLNLALVNKDWDSKIVFPAFATNLTLLYDRENRTLDQVMQIYYENEDKDNHK